MLRLEWAALDRRRREQKATDIDGLVLEGELDDIPEPPNGTEPAPEAADEMMVDIIEQQEEAELDAMVESYGVQHFSDPPTRPDSPSLSDGDDYDSLFMDLLSQQQSGQDDVGLSGEMDMS